MCKVILIRNWKVMDSTSRAVSIRWKRVGLFFQKNNYLTPKRPRPSFGPFLKFGQAIVNAIFVQKI
jgi:hypothetical protein